jgi:hypothetical protein
MLHRKIGWNRFEIARDARTQSSLLRLPRRIGNVTPVHYRRHAPSTCHSMACAVTTMTSGAMLSRPIDRAPGAGAVSRRRGSAGASAATPTGALEAAP